MKKNNRKSNLLASLSGILSVGTFSILSTFSAFAQNNENVSPMLESLTKKGHGGSAYFDFTNSNWTASLGNKGRKQSYQSDDKEVDLSILGKLVLRYNRTVDLPEQIGLIDNQYSAGATASLLHEIEGVRIPPLTKISIQGNILSSDKDNELARLEISLEGLLHKGLPEYLKKNAEKKLLEEGITFKGEPKKNNKITLTKIIKVRPDQKAIFEMFKAAEAELRDYKKQLDQLTSGVIDFTESERAKLEDMRKKAALRKNELLVQLFAKQEIPCLPTYSQSIKFPIWELGVSTDGENASAGAGVGFWGDVKINIQPTCGITVASLFQNQLWIEADVNIESNGYAGAHAEAQAKGSYSGGGIAFSGEYGDDNIELKLNEEEKLILQDIISKLLEWTQNNQKVLSDFEKSVADQVGNIKDQIRRELIKRLQEPSMVCSVFASGSNEKQICQDFSKFTHPVPPKEICSLPDLPSIACDKRILNANCQVIKEVCSEKWIPPNWLDPIGVWKKSCEQIKDNDPICGKDKNAMKKLCDKHEQYNVAKKRCEELIDKANKTYEVGLAKWNKLSDQWSEIEKKVPGLTRDVVNNYIIEKVDIRAVTEDILDALWKAEKTVDLTKRFITDAIPSDLSFAVNASAEVAFHSTAHILRANPKLTTYLSFDIEDNGQPAFNIALKGNLNTKDEKNSGIGGLDALKYTLSANINGSFAGKDIFKLAEATSGQLVPTFDKGKIMLPNEEKTLLTWSYRYNSDQNPPTQERCVEKVPQVGEMLWSKFANSQEAAEFCNQPSQLPPMLQEQLRNNPVPECGAEFNQALVGYMEKQLPEMKKICQASKPFPPLAKLPPPSLDFEPPVSTNPAPPKKNGEPVNQLAETPSKYGFKGLYTLFSPDTAGKGKFGFGLYVDRTRFCSPGDPRTPTVQEISAAGYYGLTDRLEIGMSVPFRKLSMPAAESLSGNPHDVSLQDIDESELSNVSLGMRYNLMRSKPFSLTPYVQAFLPVDKDDAEQGLGAKNTRIHFGISAGSVLSDLNDTRLYMQAAYQYAIDYDQERKDFTEHVWGQEPRFDYFGTNPLYYEYGSTIFYGAGFSVPIIKNTVELFSEFQFYHSLEDADYIPMYRDGKELDPVQDGGAVNIGLRVKTSEDIAITAGWGSILYGEETMYEAPIWKVFIGLTF
jgi:hypothetical protein